MNSGSFVSVASFFMAAFVLAIPAGAHADKARRVIDVPAPCCRVANVSGRCCGTHCACTEALSKMEIELDRDVRTVTVYVDGEPWIDPLGTAGITLRRFGSSRTSIETRWRAPSSGERSWRKP